MNGKILLIVIDQFRADCLNGALSGDVDLPNLRGLMGESVTFNRHYTVTTPCGPSRASLLTGLYAMNHRSIRNGTPLSARHVNIGTEMRKAGYEPMLFGYTDVSSDPTSLHPNDPELKHYEGLAPGFAEIVRMRLESSSSWVGDLKAKGYSVPSRYWDLYRPVAQEGRKKPEISDPALYSAQDSDSAFLTGRTIEELSARESGDWFSMVTYIRPHPPMVAPAPFNKMYATADLSQPNRPNSHAQHIGSHPFFAADFSGPANPYLYIGFDGNVGDISDEVTAELRSVYFGLATEVDQQIGRLLDYLRQSGQYDDTLIVVTADHGEMLGDHYMWGKTAPFEGVLNIPLIIRDPRNRATAGTTVEAFTESVDITPTLLDWVGQTAHIGINGSSLLPFLRAEKPENWRQYVFAELDFGRHLLPSRFQIALDLPTEKSNLSVLYDGQFKYVHFNGGLPPLLYDLNADPLEGNNLANDPAYTKDILRLSQMMLDHRMTFAHHALSKITLTGEGALSA